MKDMKKIFTYILAVAALVSCSNEIDDVVGVAGHYTAPVEIAVDGSRVFDADLNWSWEGSDVIAAYQNAGDKYINELALNAAGNFCNEAFKYAVQSQSQFHFVYPASQLDTEDYSLTAKQTGVWTPVLYGTVESATVSNLGTVEMNYLSSAFELRIWDAGRATRKNIVKAVLSSANDFVPTWTVNNDLTYTQTLSGKELSLELNGDTAIFNLGEGTYSFTLALTDANGQTITLPVDSKSFEAGMRTILNVEWKSASVTSWYEDYANNGSSALEGSAIYVNAVGGTPVVTVDGVQKSVVDGKITDIASGTHQVVVSIAGNELVNRSVVVSSIPSVTYTVKTSYSNNTNSAGHVVSKDNSFAGNKITVTASLSDSYAASNLVNGNWNATLSGPTSYTLSAAAGSSASQTDIAYGQWGQYSCYVKISLKNGYVCQANNITAHVTGIPYSIKFYDSDINNIKSAGWTLNGSYEMGAASTGDKYLSLYYHYDGSLKHNGFAVSPAFPVSESTTLSYSISHKSYWIVTNTGVSCYLGATDSATKTATSYITLNPTSTTSPGTGELSTHTGDITITNSNKYISINHSTPTTKSMFVLNPTIKYLAHSFSVQYK